MKRFDLSFDKLIHTDKLTVDFHLPTSGDTVKGFMDFLTPIKQFVLNLATLSEVNIWHATSELHLFYYFLDKDLTNFKMFLHAKTLWNLKGYEEQKFSMTDFSGSHFIAQEVDNILEHYFKAPNIELWNENIITNTLNQIKYFLISGYFEKPEESLVLCEKMRALVKHLCKMAEKGKKFFPGKEITQESGDYILYHNELSYTNNIMLINSPNHDQVFTTYNNPNFMISSNETLITYTKNWFERVKRLSQPVSLDAHQSRMLLFNQIDKKIVEYEERVLDTMMVVAPKITEPEPELVLETYQSSAKRSLDLTHTVLKLSFDWNKQHVLGVATLKFEPLFYPISSASFDAVGFDIHKVSNAATKLPLKYKYDGFKIDIELDKAYQKGQSAEIVIDYTAKPEELPEGGSAAITSDKGLFFINPLGEDPDKPMQIWTQGETENNSRWFPTVDKPNERTTQEMYLTVQDKYKTLSNGIMEKSTKNADGTRTDYWNMKQPHAPYLFMLTVGEFAKVDDKWEDIPLAYYVEEEYEADADKIFDNTPEMLEFFSDYLGVKYPWDKYSQIIVRDYVSGAMENTTGVIFGDFVQKHERELIDNGNDYIVAHEMFHHWFGDYVTCESWSNLTMNEGFANYSEYLWEEHHRGEEAAGYLRSNEMRGYLGSAQNQGTHDLIDFNFDDKEDMFDAHSYNKGGLVLHMLRNHVGDEAFRASLNKYLTDNALTAVEAHDLRLAFEAVTGEDLNWFFNQWYFDKGHPELEIEHGYTDGKYSLKVNQTQDPANHRAIFELPVKVDIYMADGSKTTEDIWVNERQQNFEFAVNEKPAFVNFDADNIILGTRSEDLSNEENIFQYRNAKMYQDRADAINSLRGNPAAKEIYPEALDDTFFSIRRFAISQINPNSDEIINKIKNLALGDPKSQVRTAALNKLTEVSDPKLADFADKVLENEQAYPTYAAALNLLYTHNPEKGLKVAETMMDETNYDIVAGLSDIFSMTNDKKYLKFFESKISNLGGFNSYPVFGSYAAFLQNLSLEDLSESLGFLINTGKNDAANFKRFMATTNLNNLGNMMSAKMEEESDEGKKKILGEISTKVETAIQEIIKMEENPQLLERYKGFGKA